VTHDLWDELGRHIHVFLASVSLADVVERKVLGRTHALNGGKPGENNIEACDSADAVAAE
jgi:Rrf2 family iron-sulfur cluster assembly transcriptional regulator